MSTVSATKRSSTGEKASEKKAKMSESETKEERKARLKRELAELENEAAVTQVRQIEAAFQSRSAGPTNAHLITKAMSACIVSEKIHVNADLHNLLYSCLDNGRYGTAFEYMFEDKSLRKFTYSMHVSNVEGSAHNYLQLKYKDADGKDHIQRMAGTRRGFDRTKTNLGFITADGKPSEGFNKLTVPELPLTQNVKEIMTKAYDYRRMNVAVEADAEGDEFMFRGYALWEMFQLLLFEHALELVRIHFSVVIRLAEGEEERDIAERNGQQIMSAIMSRIDKVDGGPDNDEKDRRSLY